MIPFTVRGCEVNYREEKATENAVKLGLMLIPRHDSLYSKNLRGKLQGGESYEECNKIRLDAYTYVWTSPLKISDVAGGVMIKAKTHLQ